MKLPCRAAIVTDPKRHPECLGGLRRHLLTLTRHSESRSAKNAAPTVNRPSSHPSDDARNKSTGNPTASARLDNTPGAPHRSDITYLLQAAQAGEPTAAERLMCAVYDELRRLAESRLGRERGGQTLQATALIHEAWLRLGGDAQPAWKNRAHFFSAAAEAMRRILVDSARRKARLRRGGDHERVPITSLDLAAGSRPDHVLAVDEALNRLALHDSDGAELIKLRFFAGLSHEESAEALGMSERTAKRAWAYARAWLHAELQR